jgi:hypothetical protein
MKNNTINHVPYSDDAAHFILDQVNKLYCAQSHLFERLSEIEGHPGFADLAQQITCTINDIEAEMGNCDRLYSMLVQRPNFDRCEAPLQSLENDFENVLPINSTVLRDFYLLNYLQNAQNMVSTAFQLLTLGNQMVQYPIQDLITKNYDKVKCGQVLKSVLLNNIVSANH